MSTGPVPPAPKPPGTLQVSLGQLLPTLIILVCLWIGYQGYHFIAAHLKVEWVSPSKPKPEPTPPAPPKPTPKPFPSSLLLREAPHNVV